MAMDWPIATLPSSKNGTSICGLIARYSSLRCSSSPGFRDTGTGS
jgi:hypothetical protein